MKCLFFTAGAVVLLCGLNGCGSKTDDSLVKDNIRLTNDLAEAIETDAPQAKVTELQKNLAENATKLRDLKLEPSEWAKFTEKHRDEWGKANKRLQNAFTKKGLAVPAEIFIY